MNFHLGVGFKIAGEQDTKQGNTGIMIFKTIAHRIRKRHFSLSRLVKVGSSFVIRCVVLVISGYMY